MEDKKENYSKEEWKKRLKIYSKKISSETFTIDDVPQFVEDYFNKNYYEYQGTIYVENPTLREIKNKLHLIKEILAKYYNCQKDELYLGNINFTEQYFNYYKVIFGNASFGKSDFYKYPEMTAKRLHGIQVILGDADFRGSLITDLNNLRIIGGNVYFNDSIKKSKIKSIKVGGKIMGVKDSLELQTINDKYAKRAKKSAKKAERTRKRTLLMSKLFGKKLEPFDTFTIQVHKDEQGLARDYYIEDRYLRNNSRFLGVRPIRIDDENKRYAYIGMLSGADNAYGVLESNTPISEIVASPYGNVMLEQMLSEEYATNARDNYYNIIGEETKPLEHHATFFGKPDFALGTIKRTQNGRYVIEPQISEDIEKILKEEREAIKRKENLRDEASIVHDLGGGLVISEVDCWMEQGKQIQFAGINREGLYYRYTPEGNPIKNSEGQYVYVGKVQLGAVPQKNNKVENILKIVSPFFYDNVVFWAENENLIKYFLERKHKGLNFALGDIFTDNNLSISTEKAQEGYKFLGGITVNEEGECVRKEEIPDSVIETIREKSKSKDKDIKPDKIIKFDDFLK